MNFSQLKDHLRQTRTNWDKIKKILLIWKNNHNSLRKKLH